MKVKVKKLKEDAVLPEAMRDGDAALDIYSYNDYELKSGERILAETGIALEIPQGYWGNIRDRSGLAVKHGIHTMAGVIDSNYRGEIKISLINLGEDLYNIKKGDRICQLIVERHEQVEIEEIDKLNETNRGKDGFASSGY